MDNNSPFELRYRIEGSHLSHTDLRGKQVWETDVKRRDRLAKVPPAYQRLTGTYQEVAAEATRLNGVQQRAGFLDYLFFPDPLGSTYLP